MEKKYYLSAYKAPYKGYYTSKNLNCFLLVILYFISYSIKYDGVDLSKRR
jgi:hypothetical protein